MTGNIGAETITPPMIFSRRHILPLVALALPLAGFGLSGCVSTVVGVGAAAATAAQEERGIEAAANDLAIKTNINGLFLDKDSDIWSGITLTVMEGRVLMTGTVRTEAQRGEAGRIAGRAKGVRTVLNELQVTRAELNGLRDRLITLDLRDKLLRDDSILSINYSLDTVNGVVYVIGIAQDKAEAARVRAHARHIEYVRRIVDHVITNDDPRRPRRTPEQTKAGK